MTRVTIPDSHIAAAAFLTVTGPNGAFAFHSPLAPPAWVDSTDPLLAASLAEHYNCRLGTPGDLYDTHHTDAGPPGHHLTGREYLGDLTGLLTTTGRDVLAQNLINCGGGTSGAATGVPTATTLTVAGTPWSSNQWANCRVIIYDSTGMWANVLSNTASVLTLDQWYPAANPTGTATPAASGPNYIIVTGTGQALFVGVSDDPTPPDRSDTVLAGEYNVTSGGLLRTLGSFARTAGNPTTTITAVYTVNGFDAPLPYTVTKLGVFASSVIGTGLMVLESPLAAPTTVFITGDTLTVTDQIVSS